MNNTLENKRNHPGPLLRRALQRVHIIHTAVCGDIDISPAQIFALDVIKTHGSLSKRELGEGINMELSNVTGLVKRLSDRGYIVETPDKTDRRVKNIRLTQKAEDLVETMQPKLDEISNEFLSPLTASEAKTLSELLKKVVDDRAD